MNACADCKHWRQFVDSGYESGPVRKHKLGLCERIERTQELTGDETMALAAVDDISEGGCLRTNESFGCALWEAKS